MLVPTAESLSPFRNDIILKSANLSTDCLELREWREEVGLEPLRSYVEPEERMQVRATIDALVGKSYGLSRDEMRFVLDPSDPLGCDYPSETFRVLKNNEIRQFGEYRTQRLVLEAWDRLFGS